MNKYCLIFTLMNLCLFFYWVNLVVEKLILYCSTNRVVKLKVWVRLPINFGQSIRGYRSLGIATITNFSIHP